MWYDLQNGKYSVDPLFLKSTYLSCLTQCYYVAHTGIEFLILLPQLFKC